ncbi:Aste57867_23264 [Aphanomyces stellatus]|uniref:Ubiquitin carboxyl-terminal hydrolase n=1 Tax=Aphanomyces stellatus TaxID=120398 RepID=A0A485LMF0_9STRA|nr:hypothetical protein As57867_023193 [Aphanomyces stellatus]VFT99909.1 Aste57867_23264 [Aphanomyces stellatus]
MHMMLEDVVLKVVLSPGRDDGGDTHDAGKGCRHVTAALNVSSLRKRFKKGGLQQCETCGGGEKKAKHKTSAVKLLNDLEKLKLNSVCIACGSVGCLQHSHEKDHLRRMTKHYCSFNMETREIWCAKCNCIVVSHGSERVQRAIDNVNEAFEDLVVGKSGRMLHAKSVDDVAPVGVAGKKRNANDDGGRSTKGDVNDSETSLASPSPPPSSKKKDRFKWKAKLMEMVATDPTLIPGLVNLGNTCYFNSTIQSLKSVVLPLLGETATNEERITGGDITHAFLAFLHDETKRTKSSKSKSVYNPGDLLTAVRERCRQFRNRAQQDAYELFLGLVWSMDDEHHAKAAASPPRLSTPSPDTSSSPMQQIFVKSDNETISLMVPADISVVDIQRLVAKKLQLDDDDVLLTGGTPCPSTEEIAATGQHTSFVRRMLMGCTVNTVTCHGCQRISKAYDDCISISASIPPPQSHHDTNSECTLHDCLEAFTASSVISEAIGSGYKCDSCTQPDTGNKLQSATVHMQLAGPPAVLVVHLKRLTKAKKISRHVGFDMAIDIAPFVEQAPYSPHLPTTYALQAVIVHSGNRYGGHYIAYVKHGAEWFHTSDTSVKRIDESVVLGAEAYMLFYVRNYATTADSPIER